MTVASLYAAHFDHHQPNWHYIYVCSCAVVRIQVVVKSVNVTGIAEKMTPGILAENWRPRAP